jgi:hypothetical protein
MASVRYQAACVSHGRRAFQPLYPKSAFLEQDE